MSISILNVYIVLYKYKLKYISSFNLFLFLF